MMQLWILNDLVGRGKAAKAWHALIKGFIFTLQILNTNTQRARDANIHTGQREKMVQCAFI